MKRQSLYVFRIADGYENHDKYIRFNTDRRGLNVYPVDLFFNATFFRDLESAVGFKEENKITHEIWRVDLEEPVLVVPHKPKENPYGY